MQSVWIVRGKLHARASSSSRTMLATSICVKLMGLSWEVPVIDDRAAMGQTNKLPVLRKNTVSSIVVLHRLVSLQSRAPTLPCPNRLMERRRKTSLLEGRLRATRTQPRAFDLVGGAGGLNDRIGNIVLRPLQSKVENFVRRGAQHHHVGGAEEPSFERGMIEVNIGCWSN